MVEHVEGEWKNFVFHMIKPEDYPEVLEHLENNFYLDEPINKYMGSSELKTQDMNTITCQFLEENLSFCARDKETNKIAGLRISAPHKKGEDLAELLPLIQSPELKRAFPVFLKLDKLMDFHQHYGVEVFMDLFMVSVGREFRNQGLATEMYRRAFLLFKAEGYSVAKCMFTSPYSQRIARKRGFEEFHTEYLRNFKDEKGNLILPGAVDSDDTVMLMGLKF